MHPVQDFVGQTFGRLTAVKRVHRDRQSYFLCICECGTEKIIRGGSLQSGNTKSCGCLNVESRKERHIKHGLTYTLLYSLWTCVLGRCRNKNDVSYHRNGAIGVSMCEEWANDVTSFAKWAEANGWEKGFVLKRKDKTKDYEPKNCYFQDRRHNRIKVKKKNNYTGVYWHPRCGKWMAQIKINRVSYHIGLFVLEKDALKARNDYIISNGLEEEHKIQSWIKE